MLDIEFCSWGSSGVFDQFEDLFNQQAALVSHLPAASASENQVTLTTSDINGWSHVLTQDTQTGNRAAFYSKDVVINKVSYLIKASRFDLLKGGYPRFYVELFHKGRSVAALYDGTCHSAYGYPDDPATQVLTNGLKQLLGYSPKVELLFPYGSMTFF